MFRIKPHHTPRISDSLAVFAALLLLVSALMSYSDSVLTAGDSTDQTAGGEATSMQTVASENPGGSTHKKNKSFRVSLFLFRID